MEPVRMFSTLPDRYASKSTPVDRPVDRFFLQKVFVHCSMHLMKNFQKRGGMTEVLKFVTPDGVSEKKRIKIFAFFAKIP